MDNGCINIDIQEYRKLKGLPPLKETMLGVDSIVTLDTVVKSALLNIKENLDKGNK